jgi:hypothetical protein
MKTIYNLLFIFLLSAMTSALHGQNKSNIEKLQQLSQEFKETQTKQKAEAVSKAKALGITIYEEEKDGQTIELQSFVNGMPRYYVTDNINAAKTLSTNQVWTGGLAGLNLTGLGQTLGEWDANAVYLLHQELTGRVTQMDGELVLHRHSTHVAGTLISQGIVPNAKGMSNSALLNAWDWDLDDAEMAAAGANGLKISNHSYGFIAGWNQSGSTWYWYGTPSVSETEDDDFGFYDDKAQAWDQIAFNAPGYLIVRSAGNDRAQGPAPGTEHYAWINDAWTLSTATREKDGGTDGYDCVSSNGTSKNILIVGAVTDIQGGYTQPSDVKMTTFSSWGPTDDGRIKPDIVGNGQSVYSTYETSPTAYGSYSGTSMASPNVAGSIGLLLEHKENLDGNSELWSSAGMKALVIHTADEAGANPGPDYIFGWGLMNTRTAAELMTKNHDAGDDIFMRDLVLNEGETYQTTVYSNGTNPLKATIVWNDPAGTPPAQSLNPTDLMLVNDLDMRLTDISLTNHFPYILDPANPANAATTGDNFRDNVEQIVITDAVYGEAYTLTVNHKGTLNGGSQAFSLIITGITRLDSFALTGPTAVHAGIASEDFTLQVYDLDGNPTFSRENNCFTLATTSTGQNADFSQETPCISTDNGNTDFTYTDNRTGTYTITSTFSSGENELEGQNESMPLTVHILPWLQQNISTANGITEFFPEINDGTYKITSTGLSTKKNDVHNFVYQQLCGTGTVIAHLNDVQNGGWAGVEMRESNAPGSKTVLFKTKLYNPSVIIGYRSNTNANMVSLSQMIPSIKWMKIQRNGNTFQVFTSYNGTTWNRRYTVNITMENCINAGFFTESIQANRTVTSGFDHPEVVNYLKSADITDVELSGNDFFEIGFYPNPAANQITIVAPENTSKINVSVINTSGLVIVEDHFSTTDAILNLQSLKQGIYLLRFEKDGMLIHKRLVIM